MAKLYDAPHPLGPWHGGLPRDLADVGHTLDLIERWGNGIPFLGVTTYPLPGATFTNATSFTNITGFSASWKPDRAGQIAVAFVSIRATQTAGTASLNLRATLQVGSGTPAALQGDWYTQPTVGVPGYVLGVVHAVAINDKEIHTIQVQGRCLAGANSWNILTLGSYITVLTI